MRGSLMISVCPDCGEAQFTFPDPESRHDRNITVAINHGDFLKMLALLLRRADAFHEGRPSKGEMPLRCCQTGH